MKNDMTAPPSPSLPPSRFHLGGESGTRTMEHFHRPFARPVTTSSPIGSHHVQPRSVLHARHRQHRSQEAQGWKLQFCHHGVHPRPKLHLWQPAGTLRHNRPVARPGQRPVQILAFLPARKQSWWSYGRPAAISSEQQ